MISVQNQIDASEQDLNCVQNSLDLSKRSQDDHNAKLDQFRLTSPGAQVNLFGLQNFHDQNSQHDGEDNNITFEGKSSSKSFLRKSRSLVSPGVEIEFSQLDQFLKQTYEKHGIYNLVKLFVDMEDHLVWAFEYMKKIHRKNIARNGERQGFFNLEEISELDEFSFQARENIIQEFLYNLQNFFIPNQSDGENINPNFSFSENNPHLEGDIITGKKNQNIYSLRSKYVVTGGIKQKRNTLSDGKMIQNINLTKSITPLKFEDSWINKIPELSVKKTDSQIIGEDSLESHNMTLANQQELLKTIFELRQQILALKHAKNIKSAVSSLNSSFFGDGSSIQLHFKSKQLANSQKDENILFDQAKQKGTQRSHNHFESIQRIFEQKHKSNQILPSSFFNPITIKQDLSNEYSESVSGISDLQLSMLESIVEESIDQENNPNFMNLQQLISKKNPKFKDFTKNFPHKNTCIFPTQSCMLERDQLRDGKRVSKSQNFTNFQFQRDHFIGKYIQNFRRQFKIEMEIQLILLKIIRKKENLPKQVFVSFSEIIDWYSGLKVISMRKKQSFQKFVQNCFEKKSLILEKLRISKPKAK